MLQKICFVLLFLLSFAARAGDISVIRDTETESLLLDYIRPIFTAAGLNPQNAEVVIVNDPTMNAFVAGGQTIFIHTGLILKAQHPDDLVFVLSHETGHIVGGHIVRGYQALQNAQTTALISTVLGGVLAVAGGRPDAGIAVMMGGQSSVMGLFTRYRQTEESAADRTAVDIVQRLGYSMNGFVEVMKAIKAEERLNAQSQDSYLRTHPLTQTRVDELKRFLEAPQPFRSDLRFDLVRAKLSAFLEPPSQVSLKYQGQSEADLYAQSILAYRKNHFDLALQLLDKLIKQEPKNPYFYELKGQFLFEIGRLAEATDLYRQAYQLAPKAPLIRLSYAQVLLEQDNTAFTSEAESLLKSIVREEPDEGLAWRLLARAYDRQKKTLYANYAMAEYDRARGHYKEARKRAERLVDAFPDDPVLTQHIQDLVDMVEE